MRARNLKPAIFTNELLAVADPLYTVIFEGLWCAADREGRLEDRPAKIHMAINPGRGFETTERSLGWLTENEFIYRYSIDGKAYIQVVMFWKHQNPHYKEPPSTIPAGPKTLGNGVNHQTETLGSDVKDASSSGVKPSKVALSPPTVEGKTRLIPDSGFLTPDSGSLIPDSGYLIPDSRPLVGDALASQVPITAPKPIRGSRIPEDFVLTAERRDYAIAKGVEPDSTFEAFTLYWSNKPTGATKLNWDKTWQSWVLKDAKDAKARSAPKPTRFDQIQAMRRNGH
jgi:hypothetical protein